MTSHPTATITKLSDSGQTITPPGEDIRGRRVTDKNGKDLGKVHDLLIDDQEHKVRFLLVEHGGFLGLGETKSFIPVDAISKITDDEISINHTVEHVAAAPPYDPELIDDRNYHNTIYSHYAYSSYWEAVHSYPGRPGYLGARMT
ncbi:MAG: PRC-barrel domain-containing protein [Mycobacteriales bacterium]